MVGHAQDNVSATNGSARNAELPVAIDALAAVVPPGFAEPLRKASSADLVTLVAAAVGGEEALFAGKIPASLARPAARVLVIAHRGGKPSAHSALIVGAMLLSAGDPEAAQSWLARASRAARTAPGGRDLLRHAQRLLLRRALG